MLVIWAIWFVAGLISGYLIDKMVHIINKEGVYEVEKWEKYAMYIFFFFVGPIGPFVLLILLGLLKLDDRYKK